MIVKRLAILTSVLVLSATLTACSQADVIGKTAVTSFDSVLTEMGDQISSDENKNSWVLESPTGENFAWSKDFSSNISDASVEFDAEPFINAGLKIEELSSTEYVLDATTNRISMPFEFSQDEFNYSGDATAIDTFRKIVETNRDIIGYHAQLDHYGISLGNGNMFEWAKDMSKNDKDIVFVLNPQPFIDAGVDPSNVEGWVFGKVKVSDENGKMVEVDKLLKPFNLSE